MTLSNSTAIGSTSSFYVLDGQDVILQAGGNWDSFAMENDAPDAMAGMVIGRRLWEFVTGREVAGFMKGVFQICRDNNQTFEMPYRCDAPGIAREFHMQIIPLDDDVLSISHDLFWSRMSVTSVENHPRPIGGSRCSICCRYWFEDRWLDPLDGEIVAGLPTVHVVCPDCWGNAGGKEFPNEARGPVRLEI